MAKKKKKAKAVKKKSAKKTAKKKVVKKKSVAKKSRRTAEKAVLAKSAAPVSTAYQPQTNEQSIGKVEDYFSRIGVIALTLTAPLSLGETIHVKGHTTDLTQTVASMEINHAPIQNAKKGDSVGIKVNDKCRKGDAVFKVS